MEGVGLHLGLGLHPSRMSELHIGHVFLSSFCNPDFKAILCEYYSHTEAYSTSECKLGSPYLERLPSRVSSNPFRIPYAACIILRYFWDLEATRVANRLEILGPGPDLKGPQV